MEEQWPFRVQVNLGIPFEVAVLPRKPAWYEVKSIFPDVSVTQIDRRLIDFVRPPIMVTKGRVSDISWSHSEDDVDLATGWSLRWSWSCTDGVAMCQWPRNLMACTHLEGWHGKFYCIQILSALFLFSHQSCCSIQWQRHQFNKNKVVSPGSTALNTLLKGVL